MVEKEEKESAPLQILGEKKSKKAQSDAFKLDLEDMAQAGLHLGHRTSKTHPKMQTYIFGIRNDIHIIDVEKTAEKFKEALEFIKKLISEGKTLFLVGTKIQAKNLVKEAGKETGLPYVAERWLGGTFTNFDTIKKRLAFFKELERKKEKGELGKYTKKERAKINQKLQDLEKKFGGIKELEKLPDAIFVLDMKKDGLAIKEAATKKIAVIAIADTNVDPTPADYVIPANDDAVSSVKYILEKVKEVIKKAQSEKIKT